MAIQGRLQNLIDSLQGSAPEKSGNELTGLLEKFGLEQDQLFGGQSDFLSTLLRKRLQGGLPPELQQAQLNASNRINRATGDALQQGRERFAGSGIGGANFITDALRTQTDATNTSAANFGQLGLQSKQSDIGDLLGLNQQQIGAGSNIFNQLLGDQQFGRSLEEMMRQFDEQLAFNKDESGVGFLDILGALTGGASTALTGFGLSKL